MKISPSLFAFGIGAAIVDLRLPFATADITWPEYNQQCRDDAGPPFLDDEPGVKYHDGSGAWPVLLEDGTCADPVKEACRTRDNFKTAYLEGPISCQNNGWYCRIFNDEANGWPQINLNGDVNFGQCNTTDAFGGYGFDQDGHCHGSSSDNTYYWWIRDHWHRQYNGRVRCCCGWYQGGSQPVTQGRIANRCDYRRLVTPEENLDDCRDANEDHGLGFEGVGDTGCANQYTSQIGNPIPEDDDVCWEIQRFGYTDNPVPVPTQKPTLTPRPTRSPIVVPDTPPPTDSSAPTRPTVVTPNPTKAATPEPTPAPSPAPSNPPLDSSTSTTTTTTTSTTTASTTTTTTTSSTTTPDPPADCVDSPFDMIHGRKEKVRSSAWVSAKLRQRCAKDSIASHFPSTCNEVVSSCDDYGCEDSSKEFVVEVYDDNGDLVEDEWYFCVMGYEDPEYFCNIDGVPETCRELCGYCD